MKKEVTISLVAILALCGCQNKELDVRTLESKPFIATIDDNYLGAETKTSLDNQGNVLWRQGDQISIFAGSTINEQWQVTDASDGKTAAELYKISGDGFNAGGEISNNVAYYPYSSTNTIAKNEGNYVIGVTLPATQNYAEASFGNGAFPMAAVTSSTADMNLKFKNILGGLKLQLKGTASIASISISGNNNEILCGDAEVTASTSNKPSINLTDGSAKTVTLDCGDGVQLNAETATPFVIALPPMTMTGGFTVTVIDTEGKQMEIKTTKFQTIARSGLLKMPAVDYLGEEHDYTQDPFTITSVGNTSVSINKVGSPDAITLEYRIGSGEWESYTIGSSINLADGEIVQFRAGISGNDSFSKNLSNYYKVVVTGEGTNILSGNIMSLLDRNLERTAMPSHGFKSLFSYCSKLSDASKLQMPAATLAYNCYSGMFLYCTSLASAPEILPATKLADNCYSGMFEGCTSLISAPGLPAKTMSQYCYNGMFEGCTSLISAPELSATTLADNCYSGMFEGCTSLISAPEILSATTLADKCYYEMFRGCTALTTAPELPAKQLKIYCYYGMFQGCTSLISAPKLPATTLAQNCYTYMFQGCTTLAATPDLLATTLAYSCYSGMFSDCTSLASAPEILPATTLTENCYNGMFWLCNSLTTAPELPATTLIKNCYSGMFYGCTKLSYVKALFTSVPSSSYTSNWLNGVSSTGTFVKSKNATWSVTGSNGIPAGWTVVTE